MRALLIIFLLACNAGAATWYVRPSVSTSFSGVSPNGPIPTPGVYGSQNGTSYANAWNGLNSIVFGGAGVSLGDTVYVCGSHIYTLSNINNFPTQARVPVTVSGFTIRMDYPSDAGRIFGGAVNQEPAANVWLGPDANGVYWSTNTVNGNTYPTPFEVVGPNITRLNTQPTTTWVGQLGSWIYQNGTNFVKTVEGTSPAGKSAFQTFGWTFDLGKQSNIVFLNCSFIAANRLTGGGVVWDLPNYTTFTGANHINWTNCALLQGSAVALFPGNDFWTFDGCEIGNATYGIYGFYDSQTRGPNAIRINNCYIHDIDTTNYPDEGGDGHGIGARDTSNWIVTGNRLERTAAAIDFFVDAGWYRTNNLVEHNFVKDVRLTHPIGTEGTGGGILFEGATTAGRSISNRVNGNILLNIGVGATHDWQGEGIGSAGPDYIQILNNTLDNCHSGITLGYSTPLNAKVENNIIANPEFRYIDFVGTGAATNLTLDYNLYYPIHELTNQFRLFPSETHDVHSVFANPVWVTAAPTTFDGFRLQGTSPAIGAGISVGLTNDFAGAPITVPPDIGAYQFNSNVIYAASCSQADIQAAIAASVSGDTVIVPAGNCAPTISILLTNQITLMGMGAGVTILQDSIVNTGDGANSSIIQVAVGPSPTNETRITGFTFQTGSRVTKLFDSGNIHLGGGANNVRIDHCNFLATQNIGIGGGDVFGVIDHCVFAPPGAFTQPMKLNHASYGGAANGYGSWALPSWTNSYHEDASAIYIENNFFTNSSGSSGLGIDGFGGARWVSRYNIYDRVIDGGHGTETTAQYAGCRLKDVYNNLFIEHGDSEPGHWRSGSGACVSNTVISCPNQFQARNYRGAFGGFYHYANATNAWDLNDATIYAAGSATAGGTLTMTDSTRAWTPSQWIGYTIRNVSSGQGSIINASTATTVSYAPPTEGANMAFVPGQAYQFRKVVTILDEVGRGQGALRNNTLPAWPNQVADPVYNWSNTFDGASKLMDNGGYYTSVVGQEIINGPNANWLPYTYPHPLVGSSVAAVTITAQPHSTNVYASQTALFTITATGSPQPFTYQWTTNGVNAGTNGPALSVGPCPVAWSGMNVICVAANAAGFATSATATLTVLPDPVITAQPNNATVGVGSTANFSVTATGQTGLTYQWSKNGSSILGATHSSYVTPVTVSGDNNSQFFAVVTDTAGSLQSANATLTVTNIISPPDPVITAQPQSTNIFATQPAAFSITATGGTPLSYQWKTNGVNSVTTQTLTFPSCPVEWSGMTIVCVVTDVAGSVTSSIATLTIGADPVIATQPQNTSRFSGTTASFNVSATGQTALTYQWNSNGVAVAGANLATYTTPILTMANNGDAYCVDATDTAGTLRSANATLTVLPAPGGPTQIARVTTLRVGVTKAGP